MTSPSPARRSYASIAALWYPMAATWLMMALEGPFLAAVIARLEEPTFNLAAWGVAYAFALLFEAPVIMMMSASTALVEDRQSFGALRRFAAVLNVAVTVIMAVALVPAVFEVIAVDLIGLPPPVDRLSHLALLVLLPWPGAIGYRRFYQGLLIRDGKTRLVAYGTVVRLVAMVSTALLLAVLPEPGTIPGVTVGAAALTAGVVAEAVVARLMARGSVRRVLAREPAGDQTDQTDEAGEPDELDELTQPAIARFYTPLVLTSFLGLAAHPIVTFFLGRAPAAVESLAVLPVVNSLVFVFRSLGLSYQDVAIALLGAADGGGEEPSDAGAEDRGGARRRRSFVHLPELSRFAAALALAASGGLALVGFTPLADVWFVTVSGLAPALAGFAVLPTRILAVLPGMSVILSFQRALLLKGRFTRPITVATAIEVVAIVALLLGLIHEVGMIGITAAAIAYVGGRLLANAWLIRPCRQVVKR